MRAVTLLLLALLATAAFMSVCEASRQDRASIFIDAEIAAAAAPSPRAPAAASSSPSSVRAGPCPGLDLSSCACFELLHAQALEVFAMPDKVSRNWWITLMYQDIGQAFQKLLGLSPDLAPLRKDLADYSTDAPFPAVGTWPSLAAWASRNAGFGIRGQALPETLFWDEFALGLPAWMNQILDVFPGLIDALFSWVINNSAEGLGGGNQFVFGEIGVTYTEYGREFCEQTEANQTALESFIESSVCAGGNCSLATSFRAIWGIQFATSLNDSVTFTDLDQMMLIQSMQTGLQEQTHLQPFINASLPGYMVACWGWNSSLIDGSAPVGWSSIDQTQDPSVYCLPPDLINSLSTAVLIHLFIGRHHMNVVSNLPQGMHTSSGSNATQDFSPYLSELNPQTLAMMQSMLGPTANWSSPLSHTAAQDWNQLNERMRFIAPGFWVFQDHPELNCFPFSVNQEAAIRANATLGLDGDSWEQLCLTDCCAANGAWNGTN